LESKLLDRLSSTLELEMPVCDSIDEYVDKITPYVKKYSEGLKEDLFADKRMVEVRDTDTYHESVLHVFKTGGEYLVVVDGNITKGSWSFMLGGMNITYGGKNEFYECAFLNEDFFVLKKHGDQVRKGNPKYSFYAVESSVKVKGKFLPWRDVMESYFNLYRENSQMTLMIIGVVFIAIVFLVFSFG
jgi:hypothetical protein